MEGEGRGGKGEGAGKERKGGKGRERKRGKEGQEERSGKYKFIDYTPAAQRNKFQRGNFRGDMSPCPPSLRP